MIKVIDKRADGVVVQKVTKPNGEVVGYQCGEPGTGEMVRFMTLQAARASIGKVYAQPKNEKRK